MKNLKTILATTLLIGGSALLSSTTTASPLSATATNPGSLCETYWGSEVPDVKGYHSSLNVSAKSWLVCDLPAAAAAGNTTAVVTSVLIETSELIEAVNYRCFISSQTLAAPGTRTIEFHEGVAETNSTGLLTVPAMKPSKDTAAADSMILACQLDAGQRLANIVLP